MFWNLGFNSRIDSILDREGGFSLDELLDEDEVLQECKASNSKLVELCARLTAARSSHIYHMITTAVHHVASTPRFPLHWQNILSPLVLSQPCLGLQLDAAYNTPTAYAIHYEDAHRIGH